VNRVPASPYFFAPVKRAFYAAVVALFVLAIVSPAPLELPADASRPPNPAKSAWFLLWIQELVAWRTVAIYAAVVLAALLVALPWLREGAVAHAAWFRAEQRPVWIAALAAFAFVAALTIVAMFFRGRDWCFVVPF
jgi:hypothetical protein